jgi:catechol 2,3-dioxygenase-like lactoylglutathione lyase family enzyme
VVIVGCDTEPGGSVDTLDHPPATYDDVEIDTFQVLRAALRRVVTNHDVALLGQVATSMIEPDVSREPGQIDQFLDRNNGAGVQHLAFLVDDIVGEMRRARAEGVEFMSTPKTYYHALARRIGELRLGKDSRCHGFCCFAHHRL